MVATYSGVMMVPAGVPAICAAVGAAGGLSACCIAGLPSEGFCCWQPKSEAARMVAMNQWVLMLSFLFCGRIFSCVIRLCYLPTAGWLFLGICGKRKAMDKRIVQGEPPVG